MKSTSNFDATGQALALRLQHSSFRKDKIFRMAFEVALSEKDKRSRNELLRHIALRCAENNFLPRALQIVKVIDERVERAGALAEVSVKSVPRVPWKRALHLIQHAVNLVNNAPFARNWLLMATSITLADQRRFKQALQILRRIDDLDLAATASAEVAASMRDIKQSRHLLNTALARTRALDCAIDSSELLYRLIQICRRPGLEDFAHRAIQIGLKKASAMENVSDRDDFLALLVSGLADAHFVSKAAHVTGKITTQRLKNWCFGEIAVQATRIGLSPLSMQLVKRILSNRKVLVSSVMAEAALFHAEQHRFRKAVMFLSKVVHKDTFPLAASRIALYLHSSNRQAEGFELWSKALRTARSLSTKEKRHQAVQNVAIGYARSGRIDLCQQALQSIRSSVERKLALDKVATEALQQSGLRIGLKLFKEMTEPDGMDSFLCALALELARKHEVQRAILTASMIERPYSRAWALADLGPYVPMKRKRAKRETVAEIDAENQRKSGGTTRSH